MTGPLDPNAPAEEETREFEKGLDEEALDEAERQVSENNSEE